MQSLTERMRAPRTLGSHVARLLVPRLVLFGAFAAALFVGSAMAVSPSAAPLEQLPAAVPVWTAADQADAPDCVAEVAWPAGKPGAEVVVHRFSDHSTQRIAFLDAWDLNHNETEVDDVWVLAVCP